MQGRDNDKTWEFLKSKSTLPIKRGVQRIPVLHHIHLHIPYHYYNKNKSIKKSTSTNTASQKTITISKSYISYWRIQFCLHSFVYCTKYLVDQIQKGFSNCEFGK